MDSFAAIGRKREASAMNSQLITGTLAGIAIGVAAMSGFFFRKEMPYQVISSAGGSGELIKFNRETGQVWLLMGKRGWLAVSTNIVETP